MERIHFLIGGAPSCGFNDILKSTLASIRLRCTPSALAAHQLGWTITYGEVIPDESSIVIVGKIGANNLSSRGDLWLQQISKFKSKARIYLDYTDHHLGYESVMTSFYRLALESADECIVPSIGLRTLLSKFWQGSISMIEDSIEIEAITPKISYGNSITLLWFGHQSNIDYLIDFLRTGFLAGESIRFIVLCNQQGLSYFSGANISSRANFEIQMALWSVENMVEAAKYSDICIIPSDLSDPKKMGASSNRLITALALGLPTAADNVASYLEFSKYYTNLRGEAFRNLLKNPMNFKAQVDSAQLEIVPHFSMKNTIQKWKDFFLRS
jgi:hypothetical protein